MRIITYFLLLPIYLPYLCIASIKNLLFNKDIFSITKLNCKVISVGNLSMGGTGKTPMVIALAKALQKKYAVAILSRGYGRKTKGMQLVNSGNGTIKDWTIVGDEPWLISKTLPGVPIVVDTNRIRGGNYLIDKFAPDLILLDDAFQHRKIHRDIDIVLLDASKKTFFQFWREPFSALKRADLLVLTKGGNAKTIFQWEKRAKKQGVPIFDINYSANSVLNRTMDRKIKIEELQGKSVIIFSGIGNPVSFTKTVEQLNCKILKILTFKDHHKYTISDINKIQSAYTKYKADLLLTTQKDIIKLPPSDLPVFAVPIEMNLTTELINDILKRMT